MRHHRVAPVMPESTGSVYLDAPRRSRPLPRRRAHRSRTVAATVLGTVGLVALTTLALLAGLKVLVIEPGPVVDAVGATFDQPAPRAELEREIADAIVHDLVGDDLATAVAAFGIDVEAEAAAVAPSIVDDPGFRAAFDLVVADVHRRVLVESDPTDVDLDPLTDAALAVVAAESPVLAGVIPSDAVLAAMEADSVRDLTRPMELADGGILIAALAALAIPLAAAIHPRRHLVVSWLGRWLLTMGLVAALVAVVLPYVGGRMTGSAIVEAAVRGTSLRLLAPAGIAGIVGMGLVSMASVAHSRERRGVADEGAAAALGVDEPPVLPMATSPQLDLARRGLVDAGQRLTNI